jgi:uncharacterized protein YndB with AHSA1/START domain
MGSTFVYVTYIRATPRQVWDALLKPEFTSRYWFGVTMESGWQPGSPWKMLHADGSITDTGEVLEIDPPRRLVLKWRNELPAMKHEGYTRCTFAISAYGDQTRLEVVHEAESDNSKTIAAVSGGWPLVLSGLKTLLETGEALDVPRRSATESKRKSA